MIKSKQLLEAWNDVTKSSIEESYINYFMQYKNMCEKFPKFLEYVKTTKLDQMKKKIISVWTN